MLHREHDGEATAFAAESKLDVKHFSHLASIKIMCVQSVWALLNLSCSWKCMGKGSKERMEMELHCKLQH